MSGQIESPAKEKTSKEELEHWDRILDEYEKGIGLAAYKRPGEPEELEQYLCMDRQQIEAIGSTDALQIAIRLQQFGFHIQRSQNREQARMSWAKAVMKKVIADDVQNYTGVSYEERMNRAVKHNTKAATLDNIHRYAEQRFNRLSFLVPSIKSLADAFFSVYHTKRKEEE